ncbi:uncharacterized protein LOC135200981 isoform X2 [Macrobrachium nipponense]|uniref:uncharacterized protein LOC135200981 isoform X2 n=1 Tax=Macrobrachium nipponense TaxID=159736 RepID=UPI0030C8846E
MSFTMDPARCQGDARRHKFLGRFAIPVQPCKMTNKGHSSSSSVRTLFMRPAIETQDVHKSPNNQPLNDECLFGDSFCDSEILEGLDKIEAQYPSKKPTGSSKPLKSAGCSNFNLNGNASDKKTRKSPKSHVSHTKDNPLHMAVNEADKFPRGNTTKDQSEFALIGNETLKAIDAMDFDNSIDEIVSPGDENQVVKPLAIAITPLRNRSKRKVSSNSKLANIRRSQRLKVKWVIPKANGDSASTVSNVEHHERNEISRGKFSKFEKTILNNQQTLEPPSAESSFVNGDSLNKFLFDSTPEELSAKPVGKLKPSDPVRAEKDLCIFQSLVKTSPPMQNNCVFSKQPALEIRDHETKNCENRKDNCTPLETNGIFPQALESNGSSLKGKLDSKNSNMKKMIVGNNSKELEFSISEQSIGCRDNSHNKELNKAGSVLKAAGHDKASCTEQSQAQSELKAGNNASSAKILAMECSTGIRKYTRFHTPVNSGRIKKPTKLELRDTGDLGKNTTKSEVQSETFHKAGVIPVQEGDENLVVLLEKQNSDPPHHFTERTTLSENIAEPGINAGDSPNEPQRKSILNASVNISKGERSFLSTQAKMDLASWGLPEPVFQRYIENGIRTMFPWQAECLSLPDVLDGKNLVYSAPTSAGKTLVSELLLLKRVLETGRKGLYILPFVSVAREKMYYLQKMFSPAGVRVEGFMGSHGPPGGLKVTDVAICTIEKANNLVNRLLEEKRFAELGIIVVDEIHMLGDPHRGYLLELLLTKTMFVCQTAHALQEEGNSGIQIVGMSATLPNLDLLALWLNSQLYSTDYRPVPLAERVKIGKTVFDYQFRKFRDLDPVLTVKGDSDHLIQLCLETVLEGFSVLVFCPTKVWCEKLAESVAKEFFCIGKLDSQYPSHISAKLRESLNSTGITKVIEALRKCPVGLDKVLGRSVSFGVAYHHAGLTFDERDIVEGGFRNGSVRVLVATSTLSSGVNLPARRVIIRSPVFGGSILDTLTYKQMIGRAGRKGVDTEGESILICREGEKQKAQTLLASTLPPIMSCLQQDSSLTSSMKRAVLEVIVSGVAAGPSEVARYCSCTLLAASLKRTASESQQDAQNSILSCVQFLEENEFIRLQETEVGMKYIGTQLGCAVLASGLSPDEGLLVFSELHRARQCFVLENELHIIYQVTPVYVSSAWPNMDWLTFLSIWESLSDDMKRVADLVGVEESFIVRAMKGTINRKVRRQAKLLAVHQRFYTALALHELVQEVPLNVVAQKYAATRGMLQSLQQSAATFAGMVTVFCNRLGWHNLELLVSQFHDRLHFGIQRELCDLVRLSSINGQRARYLYNAGLETVNQVAHSSKEDVENILHAATPFQSNKMEEKESKSGGTIWLSSNRPLTEDQIAALIVEEARQLVQKELGLSSIDWTQRQKVITTPNRCPRPRKGSSSSKRRSSSARRKYSPPNPLLQAESAAGINVISPMLLNRTVASAMTPLHRKRSRSSPQTITSLHKKSRLMTSGTEVEKVKQNAPEAKESTQLALESKEVVTRTNYAEIHASEDGKENLHNVKSGETTKEVSNSNQRTPTQLLPNEKSIFQKPHANGFSNAEKVDVDNFQGHEYVLHEVNSDSKEFNFRSNEKERKDAKGKPKNRHWKENQSKQMSRKDSQKENAKPPEKNEVQAEIQHCAEVNKSLNNQVEDSNNTVAKITARGILFGRNNLKTDDEFAEKDVRPTSFYVSESQDDKIDVFSRTRKAKAKKIFQIVKCEQSSNNNDNLLNQDKKYPPDTRITDDQECIIEIGNNQNTNSSASTNQKSHITKKIHELSYTEDSERTFKKAKIINSSSTPITDSDERLLRVTSFQGRNHLSVVNSNEDLSFEGTERSNSHSKQKIDSAVKEKRDRERDLFKDSSFEKVGEGSCQPDGIDFLSESQKEAFLMTMNSQDFDTESCRFDLSKDEKQCNESCFDIACSKRSYEALLDSEIRKKTQQLRPIDDLGGSSLTEMFNQECVEDHKKVNPCLLPKYHACEEDLGWELDLSPLEDDGHRDKVNGREILSSHGSDTEITEGQGSPLKKNDSTKPRERLPSGDMDIDGLIPLELGQSICDLQDSDCEKINAGNDSLSDSFLDRAFDTYLNISSSSIFDVEDRSTSEGEKCSTKDDDKTENTMKTETLKLLNVEDDMVATSRKNRLSDDLFSSSALLSQSDLCLQTTTSGLSKQNNHQPKGELTAIDCKKGTSVYETKSKYEPSTSSAINDDQTASSDISNVTSNSFCIIDVVGDAQLFDCFANEWKEQKRFSLSLACEKPTSHPKKGGIGWRITGHSRTPRGSRSQEVAGLVVENSSLFIVGMAVCWGGQDAYYINFKTTQEEAISCSFPTPPICENVSYEKRIAMVKEAFANGRKLQDGLFAAVGESRKLVGSVKPGCQYR